MALPSLLGRVKSAIGIAILPSSIPLAGRGLFVQKPVQPYEPILTIPQPALTIVAPDTGAIDRTCDNCFATTTVRNEGNVYSTHDDPELKLKLKACTGCYFAHYCGKKCQSEAWHAHHQYECRVFTAIKYSVAAEGKDIDDVPVGDKDFRSLIRLLLMRRYSVVGDTLWGALVSLSEGPERKRSEEEKERAEWIVRATKIVTKTKLDLDKLRKLLDKLETNSLSMMLPLVKRNVDPTVYTAIRVGFAFDPVASMANHSCTAANATWFFEGRSLRVIATSAIPSGGEILLNYCGEPFFPDQRKMELQTTWGITCDCKYCVGDGNLGQMPDELWQSVRWFMTEIGGGRPLDFEHLRSTIAALRKGAWKPVTFAELILHHHLLKHYQERRMGKEMLATCLIILFDLGLHMDPPLPLNQQLEHQWFFINVFTFRGVKMENSLYMSLEPEVRHAVIDVLVNVMHDYATDSTRLFGTTSPVAIVAESGYKRLLTSFASYKQEIGQDLEIFIAKDPERLAKNIETLLKWARSIN